MGVQRRNVPHFKGLINTKVDLGAQGRDTTSTLYHAQLRKPILLLEMAKGAVSFAPYCRFIYGVTVIQKLREGLLLCSFLLTKIQTLPFCMNQKVIRIVELLIFVLFQNISPFFLI